MLKKTKIVCTMGPATDKDGIIEQLMENGMNCARFNFSHGDHKEQLRRINNVRAAMAKTDKLVALLLDTKGPEIRLGLFPDGPVMLEKGQEFTLVNENIPGDKYKAHVNYDNLYNEVKPGDTILLSDGLVGLTVKEIKGKDIVTEVLNDGKMSDRKRVAVFLLVCHLFLSRMRRTLFSVLKMIWTSLRLPSFREQVTLRLSVRLFMSMAVIWKSFPRLRTWKVLRTSMQLSKLPMVSW